MRTARPQPMGDWFQHVVDLEAAPADAPRLASRLRTWLIQHQIIEPTLVACVLGETSLGYLPGPNYPLVVDATPDEIDLTYQLQHNGVAIRVGRSVFDTGQGSVELFCPSCHWQDTDETAWGDAITAWQAGRSQDALACVWCGAIHPITQWIFEPPWGFAHLGCTFWNWPPLTQKFFDAIGRLLGHEIRLITGTL